MCACNPADYVQWRSNYLTAPGMAGVDPVQSKDLYNCNLIAAIASCAWTGKGAWYKSATSDVPVAASYSLQFYDYNYSVPVVTPLPTLPQNPPGTLSYGRSQTASECWPGIIEKGYYMSRDRILRNINNNTPDMVYYNNSEVNPTKDPATVLYHLFKIAPQKRSRVLYGTDYTEGMIWSNLKSITQGRVPNLKINYPAIAWSTADTALFSRGHTYAILGLAGTVDTANPPNWTSKYIVMRDCLNISWEPAVSGTNVLTKGIWLNGIDFSVRDGIFALRSDLFPIHFAGYAYVVC